LSKRRKRRIWSEEEKRAICGQTRVAGVSVSQVARRYDVNANLVFTWLRDARFASADAAPEVAGAEPSDFLPVEIITPARSSDAAPAIEPTLGTAPGTIQIDIAGGHRLRISGAYDPEALARLIRGLSP
jgi:transposase